MIVGLVLDALYSRCARCGRRVLSLKLRRTFRESMFAPLLSGYVWKLAEHHCPKPIALDGLVEPRETEDHGA